MSSWVDFWNRETSIYVNERHKMLHYRGVAQDIAALIHTPGARVLDHGSGEATSADLVAARCTMLYLCDAAPNTREKIRARFAGRTDIQAIAPEEIAATIADASLDLVVANSVLQYLDDAMLDAALDQWRDKLKPGGRLILADVIPPGVSPVTDAGALLRFARNGGFFGAAVVGLARTFFSDYRKLRGALGLSTHEPEALTARVAAEGFTVRRLARNVGHNPARMTFEATKL